MADSTQSDADKIRMKRLAKLGGASNNSPPSKSAPNADASSSNPTSRTNSPAQESQKSVTNSATAPNPFLQFGTKNEQDRKSKPSIQSQPRPASPAKRDRDGSEREEPRPTTKAPETIDMWQDKTLRSIFRVSLNPEEVTDSHGHKLAFLASTREDLLDQKAPVQLNLEALEGAITEAASQAPKGKPFEYLLSCFKRVARTTRNTKYSGPEDPRHEILKETKRLCMSYCIFTVTMPEMFGENAPPSNAFVDHLLLEPESDMGICTDFLTEISQRLEEDEGIKDALIGAAEELSQRLAGIDMLGEYHNYVRGLRNLLRFPKIVDAVTKSPLWAQNDVEPQDIETKTLLGPFFRISPMQTKVAANYFSAPRTRDRSFISNGQNAIRMTLRTHQSELFQIADTIVRAGPAPRERILNWFALCVNKNHKKRAMRVDYKTVSSDGFMVNVTHTLDQLCEPFMDASFTKVNRIDVAYLRRKPRVDISDETKMNVDQKQADEFYAQEVEGSNNFISEVFFLTVAAHQYGTEAAQTRMSTLKESVKRDEKHLISVEAERHKYIHDPRYLARFEAHIEKIKQHIDDTWSIIHATSGVLLDDVSQARSMHFMRYVIVWLLRLASDQDVPKQPVKLPLPTEQAVNFKHLPEYFLEGLVENFKFITRNIPHIITPQQSEELLQVCITFLYNSEYVKNPSIKSGLVNILFYGVLPFGNYSRGILGDLLMGSTFALNYLLHALMKFYIEAESTGSHTQFYDKFNIRYEIFQVIKRIWANPMYHEKLSREAVINTDFFVQFVNMLVNDATYVLDESFTSFQKIRELTVEMESPAYNLLPEEERKQKEELLQSTKDKAKSYMGLTTESMETLILFTEHLADAFTMPEIVQRLADMLDYNLDSMVSSKQINLKVENPEEYKFNPRGLLSDIMTVFTNLGEKDNFVLAIARDGRSYRPENFDKAAEQMKKKATKSPEELSLWKRLGEAVAKAKATDEQEEDDLGEPPDEFLDPLLAHLMVDPVVLPNSKISIDRATIRSHLLSDPTDPFNRAPLKIEDVTPDTDLKNRIDAWKAERKSERAAEKANQMDTSQG
ncbi:ubiquitin conjugation factor e4 [Acrodontium crateriforme]|uniref:Ubiquitin conjugation factor e4 n=1 Tax=Acrodontium crateriforme TaxID=150365 RepID=A0AAQ3M1T4_9PEZI|nr:ubiquitin conjugation factor e4 [Acrodontium crateriforme]